MCLADSPKNCLVAHTTSCSFVAARLQSVALEQQPLGELTHGEGGEALADADVDGATRPSLPPVLLFVMSINQRVETGVAAGPRAVGTDLFLRADHRLAFDAPEADEGT